MPKNLFITFNPNEHTEQNTALRLQTIAHLYQISVELPTRMGVRGSQPSEETQARIQRAGIVLAICLEKMSPLLRNELTYAMQQQKTIVVLYNKINGERIDFGDYQHVREVHIDFEQTDKSLQEVAAFLQSELHKKAKAEAAAEAKKAQEQNAMILGLVGIGLGLLALWAFTSED